MDLPLSQVIRASSSWNRQVNGTPPTISWQELSPEDNLILAQWNSCQTTELQNYNIISLCWVSHQVYGDLLSQQWKTNTIAFASLPKISDYLSMGLFIDSLFFSIDLCAYYITNTMLSWLLWLYSKSWYWMVFLVFVVVIIGYFRFLAFPCKFWNKFVNVMK